MKKKLLVPVLLLTLICGVLFSSCTFIKENNERVASSVVSTISYQYDGNSNFPSQNLTLDITRTELLNYVNYIIYLYSQYQMDYDINDLLEEGLTSLRSQKYQMLQAMEYLMNNSSPQRVAAMYYFTDEYKAIYGEKITCEGLLTIAERYQAISDTNESFYESIDGYIEDYESENRELTLSTAKEILTGLYSDGYTVREEDGVAVAHMVDEDAENDTDKYADGLYQLLINSDYDDIDYNKIYAKITLVKDGKDDVVVYYPATESMVTLADDEDTNNNPRLTNRTMTLSYQEPTTETVAVKDDDGEDTTETTKTYITHDVVADYIKFAPRTAIEKDDNGDVVEETIDYLDGEDYKYRYVTSFTTDDEKEFVEKGQIFNINPQNLTAAEKDAYRQFRQSKKSQYIGFDESDTVYNGLKYFYQTNFQSAILTAVQYEIGISAYDSDPITDDDVTQQFRNLAQKQKEEYDLLSNKEQVAKFAKTIGTNLETCYYIPLNALLNTTYTYTDADGNEQEKAYAVENADGTYTIDMFYIAHILFKFDSNFQSIMDRATANLTDDKAIKQAKLDLIMSGLLDTNISSLDYPEITGEDLKDAYEIILDNDNNPVLDENGQQQLKSIKVSEAYNQLMTALSAAATDADKLEIFKEYMTKYNDDSGSLSSNIGYFIGMGDIEHSYDGEDFPDAAKSIYIDFLKDGSIDDYTKVSFTSYGLHVEAISFTPFDHVAINDLGSGLYTMSIDKALDLTGENTFDTTLRQSLISTLKTKAYSTWTSSITNDEAEAHSTVNKKVLKAIKKDLDLD